MECIQNLVNIIRHIVICVSEIEDGKCKKCGSKKIVKGVEDRIFEIADRRKYIT